jgi:hypothetical protein
MVLTLDLECNDLFPPYMDAVSSVQCKLAVSAARLSYFFLVVIYQENGLCGLVWLHTKWILHGTHCNVFLVLKYILLFLEH